MAEIKWDQTGEKVYEAGVDRGVLYLPDLAGKYKSGVPWNGLTAVTESPSGAESSKSYADNQVYANLVSAEEFGATLEAYTYPDEFAVCDGTAEIAPGVMIGQQARKAFGLSYRTKIGNDLDGMDHGYKLHIIYNALAKPSEKAYNTINDSPEAMTLSWEMSTTPIPVTGKRPTATLVVDSTKVDPADLAALEAKLYGGASSEPELPTPDEIVALFETTTNAAP